MSITGHLALLQSEGKSVEEAKVVAPRQWWCRRLAVEQWNESVQVLTWMPNLGERPNFMLFLQTLSVLDDDTKRRCVVQRPVQRIVFVQVAGSVVAKTKIFESQE